MDVNKSSQHKFFYNPLYECVRVHVCSMFCGFDYSVLFSNPTCSDCHYNDVGDDDKKIFETFVQRQYQKSHEF